MEQKTIDTPSKLIVYPVIHFEDVATAVSQLDLVKEAGCTGAFLINHEGMVHAAPMLKTAREYKDQHPEFQMGINLLSHEPLEAATICVNQSLDSTCFGDMGVSSAGVTVEGKQVSTVRTTRTSSSLHQSLSNTKISKPNLMLLLFWLVMPGSSRPLAVMRPCGPRDQQDQEDVSCCRWAACFGQRSHSRQCARL